MFLNQNCTDVEILLFRNVSSKMISKSNEQYFVKTWKFLETRKNGDRLRLDENFKRLVVFKEADGR